MWLRVVVFLGMLLWDASFKKAKLDFLMWVVREANGGIRDNPG